MVNRNRTLLAAVSQDKWINDVECYKTQVVNHLKSFRTKYPGNCWVQFETLYWELQLVGDSQPASREDIEAHIAAIPPRWNIALDYYEDSPTVTSKDVKTSLQDPQEVHDSRTR